MQKDDKILDAVGKDIGPRTCPECEFQFPLSLFVKRYVMKFGFPKWTCPSCHQLINYNYFKSNVMMAIGFVVVVGAWLLLQSKLGLELSPFVFLIPYFFFILMLLNFDKIEKYKD